MTRCTLIRRSLQFRARSHLGTVLGAAAAGTMLIGALVVGDSVRDSLRERALRRLGWVDAAVPPSDRFFTQASADRIQSVCRAASGDARLTPILALPTLVSRQGGTARANRVNLLGIRPDFWPANASASLRAIPADAIVLNESLAEQLHARTGDELVVRIRKPGALSSEMVLSPQGGASTTRRVRVHAIAGPDELGDFGLQPSQVAPWNAFMPIEALATAVALPGRANMLLARGCRPLYRADRTGPTTPRETAGEATRAASEALRLEDAELNLHELPGGNAVELQSSRVFLDPAVSRKAARFVTYVGDSGPSVVTNGEPILSYLVNQFRAGTNTTPYSMVTAAGPPYTPPDLRDDEIVLNDWLADDLQVKPGDRIDLTYFDPDSGARLVERTNAFRVHSVVPMKGVHADRTLMPEFPGLAKAESTHDWDAGFPLMHTLRDKDETYWKQHRGTPKAFVTLAAGQKMWANRFGNLTAIRYAVPTNSFASVVRDAAERNLLANLDPASVGLRFEPVREQALQAVAQSQDFGGLFLGFSFFLIVAALVLMSLLFQFDVEQRATEVGTLLALGFIPRQVRRLLLLEGGALAVMGSALGLVGGLGYARAMLRGLSTVWRDAVGMATLSYHAEPATLGLGLVAAVAVAWVTLWLALRQQARQPARELLAGDADFKSQISNLRSSRLSAGVAALAGLSALVLVATALRRGDTSSAGTFFSAGALLLVAGVALSRATLRRLGRSASASRLTLSSLGVRSVTRRPTRSLATLGLFACGSFLIASIGVFRLDPVHNAEERSSGTGGFALLGETTLPVVQDLNTPRGRDLFALGGEALPDVRFVPLRVRDGDEASCLNLNRAQKPRLLGVNPESLAGRFTFTKVANGEARGTKAWGSLSLNSPIRDPKSAMEIPAIGDAASIEWALGKKVGDALNYVDEGGRPFKVRIVGAVANSILQGNLLIDEAAFVRLFPSEAGYRMFLIEAPSKDTARVSETLSRALRDVGLELMPTTRRLAQFNAVQNTYLGTFQVLGGLGLLLGSVGLGALVLRNVLERRGELALLLAVGFRRAAVRWLVMCEHTALLLAGLGVGVMAAWVAVLPVVLSPGTVLPYGSLAVTLGGVLVGGILWTWLATRVALGGGLLQALRNE